MISFLVGDTAEGAELFPSCLIADATPASVALCRAEDQALQRGGGQMGDWSLPVLYPCGGAGRRQLCKCSSAFLQTGDFDFLLH